MQYLCPGGCVEKRALIAGEEQLVPAMVGYWVNYVYWVHRAD